MKQNKNLKEIIKYVLLFFTFLIFTLIISPMNIDEIWNYGFSYNIYKGLVPYRDFNMVLTPFYPMFMSLFLHIFGKGIISMHIANAGILCLCSYLLFKMYGKKAYLIIIMFFIPFYLTFPNYNSFLAILTIILIYLEKMQDNKKYTDYIIGIILGCLILTKQTVGICVLIGSLLCASDKDKIKKRLLGCGIPTILFIIYLLITNSYRQFLDLCVFGLLDFSKNSQGFNGYTVVTTLLLLFNLYVIVKEKNKIAYYPLFFASITIPICDLFHLSSYLIVLSNIIVSKIKKNYINYKMFFVSLLIIESVLMFSENYSGKKSVYPNDLNNFNYRYISRDNYDFTKKILKWMDKKDKEIVLLDANAYYFKLIQDKKIGYIDLINQGNWGYDGSKKLVTQLKKYKETYFLINRDDYKNNSQIDKNALKYISNHGKKIKKIGCYDIYYIK